MNSFFGLRPTSFHANLGFFQLILLKIYILVEPFMLNIRLFVFIYIAFDVNFHHLNCFVFCYITLNSLIDCFSGSPGPERDAKEVEEVETGQGH